MEHQPDEIIIEQLRYLPLKDLLSACQTNSLISGICQGRRLWEFRLMDEFKVNNLREILNPREYYFVLVNKRRGILRIILESLEDYHHFDLDDDIGNALRNSYHEFLNFQREKVNSLSEDQIKSVLQAMDQQLAPYTNFEEGDPYTEYRSGSKFYCELGYIVGFYFSPEGNFDQYMIM